MTNRRRVITALLCVAALGAAVYIGAKCRPSPPAGTGNAAAGKWQGVDDTVVGKSATEAGRPPRRPFIDTDQGDLLLFVFLLAGIAGGFVLGYNFRALFGKKGQGHENAPNA
jgi:hypothetical protein